MAKHLKIPVLWTSGLLIVVMVCLFAALPWLVSTDLIRGAVEREISNFAGRNIVLDGEVELDLFPSPKARITNLRVPAPDSDDADILVINRIEADISLLTILSRNPKFTAFKLDGPQLTLQHHVDTGLNWANAFGRINAATQLAKSSLAANAQTQQENAESAPSENVQLLPASFPSRMGTVSFSSGTIVIEDDQAAEPVRVTALNGMIAWNDLAGAANGKANGVYNGQPVLLEAQAQRPLALLAGDRSSVRLSGESDLGKFSYEGAIGIFDSLFIDGNIQMSAPALSPLIEWMDGKFKPSGRISGLSLSGAMQITERKARFEPLDIQLDNNIGKGLLEVTYPVDEKPLISGTFDFADLNLTDLIDVFVNVPDSGLSSLQEPEFKLLEQIRTDLRVSATTAKLGALSLSNLAATAQINEGAAIFDIGDVQLFGGNLQSQLQLSNSKQGKNTVQVALSGQQIDTNLAAQNINLPSIIPFGKADFTFTSQSNIASWHQMTQSAEGNITLKMSNGIMRGFGAKTLLETERTDQFFTITTENSATETFDTLEFKGALSDGVITIHDTVTRYPAGEVHFEGVAPYRSSGIALTAIATPLGADKSAVPKRYFIGGSWERAFATPLMAPSSSEDEN